MGTTGWLPSCWRRVPTSTVPTRMETPLCTAAVWGNDSAESAEVVKLLLSKGADAGRKNKKGETALDVAKRLNKTVFIVPALLGRS